MLRFRKTLLAAALTGALVPFSPGLAEDIDIYARPPSDAGVGNPNILIIVDNSANWADNAQHFLDSNGNIVMQGEAQLRAIRNVVSTLNDKVNVGLMMFTEGSSATNPNGPGGYVRFKVRQMTQDNKTAFSELIGYGATCTDGANSLNLTPNCIYKNFNSPSEKTATSKTNYSAALFEAYKYFGGYTSPAHATDNISGWDSNASLRNASQFGPLRYAGAPDSKSDPFAFQSAVGDTTPSADANRTEYVTPIGELDNCADNYIIFVGNGFPTQDSPASLLSGVGGDTTQIKLNNLSVQTLPASWYQAGTANCGLFPDKATCEATLNQTDPLQIDASIRQYIVNTYPLMGRDGTGYDNYRCTELVGACPANVPITESLGTSTCGAYSSAANCIAGQTAPGYDSYSCDTQTGCSRTIANPDAPFTPCTTQNLNTATNCNDFGVANYPSYSGFSCSKGSKVGSCFIWTISATNKTVSGNTYKQWGTRTLLLASASFNIEGSMNVTATAPTGTFYYPTSNNSPTGTPTNEARFADEWARFLNKTDISAVPGQQNVTTFTIDVFKDRQNEAQTRLLMSMAREGGGKYFTANNENAIVTALKKIMSEIQSVNSVFASSSLPVSVNTQGTYLNQVFMGMFRPEGSAAPRWAGNLKQYEFKIFNGELLLSDKHGNQAISATTGFITPCAASFWTTDTGNYWNYPTSQANGDCTAFTSNFPSPGSSSIFSDWPDGEVVEKGGAAQKLRGVKSTCNASGSCTSLVASSENYTSRNLLTCNPSGCGALETFVPTRSYVSSALSAALVNWIRGQDMDDENANGVTNEVRPSVHGGVVHSQPAVVDYGGTTGVVAFYGADDGVLHAVSAGQTDSDGSELWGFIAPETFGRFERLRDNGVDDDHNTVFNDKIAYPADSANTPWDAGYSRKDYFFDGSIGIFQTADASKSTGQRVWMYVGMRRGGRAIYAFDISVPGTPVLKWRKGCFTNNTFDDTNCSTDPTFPTAWRNIGQTWSKPTVGYLNGYVDGSGKPKPVVVFGGGYSSCEDYDGPDPYNQTPANANCTSTSVRKGAQVWIVDADTGAIIRMYPVSSSTPGDVALVNDLHGYLTHIYVSDINGDIYRMNIGTYNGTTLTPVSADVAFVAAGWSSNANYSAIEIADLSSAAQPRKFLNGPNVVPYLGYNAVLIGSGDREHPLVDSYACRNFGADGTPVTNQFYMIKDHPNAYPATPVTPASLTNVNSGASSPVAESSINANGWVFDFGACEQSVNRPLTVAGVTYFGTNTPSPSSTSSCLANLGISRGYAIDFSTGNPIGDTRSAPYVGGGMPPSPVAGVVEVDGEKLPFIIGGIDTSEANPSALEGSKVEINPSGSRTRTYWYIESD